MASGLADQSVKFACGSTQIIFQKNQSIYCAFSALLPQGNSDMQNQYSAVSHILIGHHWNSGPLTYLYKNLKQEGNVFIYLRLGKVKVRMAPGG